MQRRGFLSLVGSAVLGGCVGGRTTTPPPDPIAEFTATAPWPMAGFDASGTGRNPTTEPLQNQAEAWNRDLSPHVAGPVSVSVVTDETSVFTGAHSRVTAFAARDGDHRWSYDFTHRTVAGLAVADDALVATATGPAGPALAKFDTESGEVLWSRLLNAAARGPPVVTENRIFVLTAAPDGGIRSFNHDGELLWGKSVVARNEGPRPTVVGDSVFVNDGGELLALEAKTGEIRWRRRLESPLTQPPVATDSRVYATTASGLSAFDVDSNVVWEHTLGETVELTCPCVAGETVAVADERGRVTGLHADDGDLSWRSLLSGSVTSPLIAADETVTLATESGLLTAIVDGSTRWTRELPLRERFDAPLRVTLVPAHDRLYVALNDGWLYALG
ncbi:PQQ-binding-like beta-propeller repeat protein [Haladaptatus sp. YSMS36]|uniref:outer membrane protein assembly factor BamB family protein n=1 Tax=Haladaptatus sp. YSMS36 TaxID=3033384 RepID=UPI0023E78F63|nr:PQQ-binding-like beta-propeller repeat protein [Haladaptatus sp. YSMS36]